MKYLSFVALAAASLCFAAPAAAQSDPFVAGDFVAVTGVTIDDGHYLDYATFLSGYYKAQEEFAISQGWQTSWEVLRNVDKRKGEPDLYLIRRFKAMADGPESERRGKLVSERVKMTDAELEAASGGRAKFRHIEGTQLLRALTLRK